MKKCLIFILLPASVWATELHPEEECEDLKSDLLHDLLLLQTTNSYTRAELGYAENWLTDSSNKLSTALHNLDNGDYGSEAHLDFRYYIDSSLYDVNLSLASVLDATKYNNSAAYQISSLKSKISAVDCTSCSNTNCCDFSEIIAAIQELENNQLSIQETLTDIYGQITYLEPILNELQYTNFLLEHGFGDITNLFESLLFVSSPTSRFGIAKLSTQNTSYNIVNKLSSGLFNDGSGSATWMLQGIGGTTKISIYDMLKVITANSSSLGTVVNRLAWIHDDFRTLTNTVGHIHQDTTNFFSFFRGEIGVQSVLEDWTNAEADGTYYEFLTNHYISVVKGGQLSGNSSTKTNWFSRIETLLASLVFLDSSSTNAYDSAAESVSNEVNRVQDSFNSTIDGVSSSPGIQMELAADIERSMYQSLLAFSKAFSSATLPSSVQLLHVSKTSGSLSRSLSSDDVDVTVSVDGKLMDFVEVIRSSTTLCWVFFGLWFMFKFSVWTVKKIYMLIRYIIDFFNMVAGGK